MIGVHSWGPFFEGSIFDPVLDGFLDRFWTPFMQPEEIRSESQPSIFRYFFGPRFRHRFFIELGWILEAFGFLLEAPRLQKWTLEDLADVLEV